jgi:hypothetical protein
MQNFNALRGGLGQKEKLHVEPDNAFVVFPTSEGARHYQLQPQEASTSLHGPFSLRRHRECLQDKKQGNVMIVA